MSYRAVWLALGWLWVVSAFYLSLMPQPYVFKFSDKLNHAMAYALLMLWFCQHYVGRARFKLLLWLVFMGVLIEFLQGLTGYRYFEFADMLANSIGVLLGWGLAQTGAGKMLLVLVQKWGAGESK